MAGPNPNYYARSGLLDFLTSETSDDLTYRSSMLPIGTYRGSDGRERAGLAWPQLALDAVDAMEAVSTLDPALYPEEAQRHAGTISGLMMGGGLAAPRPGNALAKVATATPLKARGYHGTPLADGGSHVRGQNAYWASSDPNIASSFANRRLWEDYPSYAPNVEPADFNFRNPLVIKPDTASPWYSIPFEGDNLNADGLAKIARNRGHDGLVLNNIYEDTTTSPATTYAALKPGTVTSSTTGETLFSNGSKGGAGVGIAEATANALPMDQASRMVRAREMGFDTDTPLYHGTHRDFDEFRPSENGKFGAGVYFSPDRKEAYDWMYADVGEGRVIDAYARGKLAGDEDWERAVNAAYQANKSNPSSLDLEIAAGQFLQNEGFSGLNSQRMGETVIFDPRNIRSVNAAFDPAKSNSANLLAANSSPSTGLMSLYGYDDEYDPFLNF